MSRSNWTGRIPRSTLEAFPGEAWRGVIERHPRPVAERVADVLMACVLGIGGAALLVHWICQ